MSLLVWLPLIGDLHNQGLSDVNITTSVTFTDGGKIGEKCLSSTTGWFSVPEMNNKKLMSFAYWVKINAGTTTNWLDTFTWKSTNGSSDSTNRQEFYYYSSDSETMTTGVWYPGKSNSGYSNQKIGEWNHYTFTIDYESRITKVYINGILKKTTTDVTEGYYIKEGASFRLRESTLNSSINDFRLYDNVLSDKEVEEIAKGLILHYKLNNIVNDNLLLDTLKDKNASHTTYNICDFNFKESLIEGLKYTITAKVITSSEKTAIGFYHSGGSYSMSGWMRLNSDHFYQKTFTATADMASRTLGIGHGFCRVYISNNPNYAGQSSYALAGTANVEWIKIEKGSIATPYNIEDENIIYDSSGYNRFGIKTEDIVSTVSANGCLKYNYSLYTDGTQLIGIVNTNEKFGFLDNSLPFTISICVYCVDWTNACADKARWILLHYSSDTSIGGFRIYSSANANRYRMYWMDTAGTALSIYFNATGALNGWHMFTATFDGSTMKTYRDGIYYTLKTDTSVRNSSTAPEIRIGNGSSTIPGYYNDLRIYATALTADLVLELYNTSATIDNKGNVYAREFIE